MTKHEIVLAIISRLFVLETVSVIVQVLSFKLTESVCLQWHHCITISRKKDGLNQRSLSGSGLSPLFWRWSVFPH